MGLPSLCDRGNNGDNGGTDGKPGAVLQREAVGTDFDAPSIRDQCLDVHLGHPNIAGNAGSSRQCEGSSAGLGTQFSKVPLTRMIITGWAA